MDVTDKKLLKGQICTALRIWLSVKQTERNSSVELFAG